MNQETCVHVVLAADDRFAMPLAVTVRSLAECLQPGRALRLFVIDGGISDANRQKLIQSWPASIKEVNWINAPTDLLTGLDVKGHVTVATYFRILIPELLPADVQRVLYLDADLLVRSDVTQLWEMDFGDRLCLAVQDLAAPYVNSLIPSLQSKHPQLAAGQPCPIRNYRDLGLAADLPYFNGGVLMIDLARWRAENLSTQFVNCLRDNAEDLLWWDQYALNVVLAGKAKMVDPRWNQGETVYRFESWEESHLDQLSFEQVRNDPYIVHFTSTFKPWHFFTKHPYRQAWFEVLDRTEWRGWRPGLGSLMKQVWNTDAATAVNTAYRTFRWLVPAKKAERLTNDNVPQP